MNTTAQQLLLVNFGELMRTVIVLKVLMLVKMNGDQYVYILNKILVLNGLKLAGMVLIVLNTLSLQSTVTLMSGVLSSTKKLKLVNVKKAL